MIAIGNVKLGMRIEPIYVQELSREEVNEILQAQGVQLDENLDYPIDTRIVNIFKTDKQKLAEYIELCKYAFDKKSGRDTIKPHAKAFSIFDDELQINYELKDIKESETMDISNKVRIYRQAKETQSIFKMFGARNVNIDISLLDRAYFEVQSFIQTITAKKRVPVLAEKNPIGNSKGSFRESLFDQKAQKATQEVSKEWQEQGLNDTKRKEVEEFTKT